MTDAVSDQENADQDLSATESAIQPLRDAQTAYTTAQKTKSNAQTALDTATSRVTEAEQSVQEKEQALIVAKDLFERAKLLSLDDAMENEITDDAYSYLNAKVRALKNASAEKNAAIQELAVAQVQYDDAAKVYEDAKKEHIVTLANLAIAQAAYDKFAPKKSEEKSDIKAPATENKKETKNTSKNTVKTGDNANTTGALAMMAGSLVAIGAVLTGKKKREE